VNPTPADAHPANPAASAQQPHPLWAVLSDIHGNLPALHAVLSDARAQGATAHLNLGDILAGPLWPAETARLLMLQDWPTIAGNHERQMLTQAPDKMGASDRYAAQQIDDKVRQWMAALPTVMRPQEQLLCVHGTPSSDLHYLLETVTADHGQNSSKGVRQATPDEVRPRLGQVPATLVLCGHSHMPRHTMVDATELANPGSVGLPAFEHDEPHLHDMETGTPQARYALVQREALGWRVSLRAVDYDYEAAARQAEKNHRPDWADALRTGRMGRRGG
jgi:predicted phosphodiesterase